MILERTTLQADFFIRTYDSIRGPKCDRALRGPTVLQVILADLACRAQVKCVPGVHDPPPGADETLRSGGRGHLINAELIAELQSLITRTFGCLGGGRCLREGSRVAPVFRP